MAKKPKIKETEVFPGDKLAVIEEYNDGKGTYQVDGEVRSTEMGKSSLNEEKRAVEVKKRTPEILVTKEGMIIIAAVGSVARRDARVDIFNLDGKNIHPTYSGVIHISNISRDYIKNIDMAYRSGDTIKAKIINTKNRLNQLTTADPELGAVYAYCSRCGGLLEKKQGKLTCPDCGRIERRKTARNYGKEKLV